MLQFLIVYNNILLQADLLKGYMKDFSQLSFTKIPEPKCLGVFSTDYRTNQTLK